MHTEEIDTLLKGVSPQDLLEIGSNAFTKQLFKMVEEKVIAPYSLIIYHQRVLDLYKAVICANSDIHIPMDIIQESKDICKELSCAITKARIEDTPYDNLETLISEYLYPLSDEHAN